MTRIVNVKPTRRWAVRHIAKHLRPADERELRAIRGADATISDVLFDCVERSDWTLVGYIGDEPICIGGVAPSPLQRGVGHPWMLGTRRIEDVPKTFIRITREMVAKMHETYPTLTNFVMKANDVHVRYLRHLGFTFGDEYLIQGEPFLHFTRHQDV